MDISRTIESNGEAATRDVGEENAKLAAERQQDREKSEGMNAYFLYLLQANGGNTTQAPRSLNNA